MKRGNVEKISSLQYHLNPSLAIDKLILALGIRRVEEGEGGEEDG